MSKIAKKGHNRVGGLDTERLTTLVARIEQLQEEKAQTAESIKDVFVEAKSAGFDNRTLREMLKLRQLRKDELEEREHLRDVYIRALNLLDDESVI